MMMQGGRARQVIATVALLTGAASPAAWAQGHWQVPGAIQRPTGPWQTPGAIQKAGPIQSVDRGCERRVSIAGDALFAFNKASLAPAAAQVLANAATRLNQPSVMVVAIEGHTDSIGGASYNHALSLARARTVRDWLAARRLAIPATAIAGYGATRPVAANTLPGGGDNPAGRAKNRRVEIVARTCG